MNKDLTTGSANRALILFTLPMFISVIFQQLYNMADSVIAGRYAGEDALAAVGASYPITMIFMAVAVGSQVGCSVVISRFFGAKDYVRTRCCISTTLIAGLVLSAVLTLAGVLCSAPLMRLVNTPDNIFAAGKLYLQVYTAGFLFLFMYNVTTGIFSSLGDSKTPLYFLIASSLGNVALDVVFVIVFHWGVAGVAWATFIAQGIACVLSVLVLRRRMRQLETAENPQRFSWAALREIARVAIPSILQQGFVSVGNLFIQYLVNGFGSSVIAGYSAAIKLNTFAITSCTTLGSGISSFTAQNLGAGKPDRIRSGFRTGALFSVLVSVAFSLLFCFLGSPLLRLFMNQDSTVLAMDTGLLFLRIVAPFYCVVAVKISCDSVLRGGECMQYFMITTFLDLALRVILAFVFSPLWQQTGIWLAWPISWTLSTVLSLVFYRMRPWEKRMHG